MSNARRNLKRTMREAGELAFHEGKTIRDAPTGDGSNWWKEGFELARSCHERRQREDESTWVGCGECDSTFACFNGETRCIRLEKTS